MAALNEEEDHSWQLAANCLGVDPDLFFPERGASTKEAKAVCQACEVRGDCLEYALANGEKFGIWGGLSERERRRIRRQRALGRAAEMARSATDAVRDAGTTTTALIVLTAASIGLIQSIDTVDDTSPPASDTAVVIGASVLGSEIEPFVQPDEQPVFSGDMAGQLQ